MKMTYKKFCDLTNKQEVIDKLDMVDLLHIILLSARMRQTPFLRRGKAFKEWSELPSMKYIIKIVRGSEDDL